MANLSGIAIDANVAVSEGVFEVLPAGKFKVAMVGDELKDNKAGTGKILEVRLQVIAGQFAQEIVKDNINITNPSAVCQAIGQGTLKRICNLCNVQFPPTETTGLMGKPMVITVGVQEFISNTTGKTLKSNTVKKYEAADTVILAAPDPAQGNQALPQQNTASSW